MVKFCNMCKNHFRDGDCQYWIYIDHKFQPAAKYGVPICKYCWVDVLQERVDGDLSTLRDELKSLRKEVARMATEMKELQKQMESMNGTEVARMAAEMKELQKQMESMNGTEVARMAAEMKDLQMQMGVLNGTYKNEWDYVMKVTKDAASGNVLPHDEHMKALNENDMMKDGKSNKMHSIANDHQNGGALQKEWYEGTEGCSVPGWGCVASWWKNKRFKQKGGDETWEAVSPDGDVLPRDENMKDSNKKEMMTHGKSNKMHSIANDK